MIENCFTVAEVAEMLHVSPKTVYNQSGSGSLRCIRFGRCVRIPVSAVEDILDEPAEQDTPLPITGRAIVTKL